MLLIEVGGLFLVLGLWPMAQRLAGSFAVRMGAITSFLFFAFAVNSLLEASVFTHFVDGSLPAESLVFGLEALFVAFALAFFFGGGGEPAGFPRRGWLAWTGRGAIAWLAWPTIYFFFGACVAPIVVPYYNAGIAGLRLPTLSVIFEMQLLRSLIFLAASLPFVTLWKGSRRGLWLALGLAHAFVVGMYGLMGATFLPMVLRIAHGAEMTGDSFAYAGVLVLLFGSGSARAEETSELVKAGRLSPHVAK
jgi:hypothetical protein